MRNNTQIERYKKLLSFIDENFKEPINIERIEEVCHYSYRNINRIFEALHHETIGKYIKRLRLEKAAQYLKYSEAPVADIGFEVGFESRAAFSKAFKNKFGCSPLAFRTSSESIMGITQRALLKEEGTERQELQFEIEYAPAFEYLFLEYRGDYQAILAIEKVWEQLLEYASKKELLNNQSYLFSEIIDDNEISDKINLRYNLGLILEKPLPFEPQGLFRINKHARQKYVKFTHQGSHQSCYEFYNKIYAYWMLDVKYELEDLPTLEFYPNFEESLPADDLITEIYIPIR